MDYTQELIAIDSINALFWNYTRADIEALKSQFADFAYVWETYVAFKSGEDAFNELWRCWMLKFNVETKAGIVAYAVEKWGKEQSRNLESARVMKAFWKSQEHGD